MSTALVWFRRDLRLSDNPALAAAVASCRQVIPVYIHEPNTGSPWTHGKAQQVWLHHSLQALDEALKQQGSRLILRKGPALPALRQLVLDTGATTVLWNRAYEPESAKQDQQIEKALAKEGLQVKYFNGALLSEPGTLQTGQGSPYRVFTAYAKALKQAPVSHPLPKPRKLPKPPARLQSMPLAACKLLPEHDWWRPVIDQWQPGEVGAHKNLKRFLRQALAQYKDGRNYPAKPGVSRLSPHLHFGEISPRQNWASVQSKMARDSGHGTISGGESFLNQLIWRDFAYHLLHNLPHTIDSPLDARFKRFPWSDNPEALRQWQTGQTGIPIVDAGMRELWHSGWMHNRVRMIVASFLTKNLLIPWQEGARWFWDTLFDADLANNTLGWQWVAGCGADAAPYFRIFNPVLQGSRFDSDGQYVRRWVPELSQLPTKYIHQPWLAPAHVLEVASVTLGQDYPYPIVDLAASRQMALDAYADMRADIT